MKNLIYYVLVPFTSLGQVDTASFAIADQNYNFIAVFEKAGTENLFVSDSSVRIQIEKTPVCDFFGKYDETTSTAYFVMGSGNSCLLNNRFMDGGGSDQFAYVFSDNFPKSACAYCICFSADGHDLVAKPDGAIEFDGRVILRSFSAYLTIYTFVQK